MSLSSRFVSGTVAVSPVARREFPCSPRSPGAARQFVGWMLELWGLDGLAETAVLLTSELVTDAVESTVAPFEVRVGVEARRLRLEVREPHDPSPLVGDPCPLGVGGRGRWLVERLATRWGTEPDGAGTVVWCELAW